MPFGNHNGSLLRRRCVTWMQQNVLWALLEMLQCFSAAAACRPDSAMDKLHKQADHYIVKRNH